MDLDSDQLLANAVRDGVREAVKAKFTTNYNNPLEKPINDAISVQTDSIRCLVRDAINSCLTDAEFRDSFAAAVRSTLAKSWKRRSTHSRATRRRGRGSR
jgi:hypothetical protein